MKTARNQTPTTTTDPWVDTVLRFQAGRIAAAEITAGGGKGTSAQRFAVQAGTDAAGELIVGLLGLAMDRIRQEAVLRREVGWFERNIDDLRGDAIEWLLQTLEKFNTGEGTVTGYVATRSSWLASDLLYAYSQDAGKLEYSWYKIRSAATTTAARLRELNGRAPSNAELADALLEEARTELSQRYVERFPELRDDADQLARRVHDRLSRDGIFAAVRQLDAILELGAADVRFDAVVGDGEDVTTIGEMTPSSFDVEAAVLNRATGRDPLDDLYAVALGDAQWARASLAARFGVLDDVEGTASLPGIRRGGEDADRRALTVPRLAELNGRDKAEVRAVLNAAGPRLGAPHTQFAHLAAVKIDSTGNQGLSVYDRADFVDA